MSKAPRDEQSESGEAVVVKQERAAREFWIVDNGEEPCLCYSSKEEADLITTFKDHFHVIEKSAYDALKTELEDAKNVAVDRANEVTRLQAEAVVLVRELKKQTEGLQKANTDVASLTNQLEQAKQGADTLHWSIAELNKVLTALKAENEKLAIQSHDNFTNWKNYEREHAKQLEELTRLRERIKETKSALEEIRRWCMENPNEGKLSHQKFVIEQTIKDLDK